MEEGVGRAPESSAESLGEQGLGGETEREQPVEQDAGFLLADVERIFKRGIMMFDEHEDLRGREKKVSKATPSHYGTQARSPRIEPGKQGRPSGLFAGAVPVERQRKRERAMSHIPKNVGIAIQGATGLPQGRTEERLSPSETSLLAPALSGRPLGSRDQGQKKSRVSATVTRSEASGTFGLGRGSRPLANAVTAQRGEWRTLAASSGRRGARGGTPGRGLALPGRDGELAKKRCANAQLAKRRSLGRAAALPAACGERPPSLAPPWLRCRR